MFVRFKCRYPGKCGSSAPRSHRHKAVLRPAALMLGVKGSKIAPPDPAETEEVDARTIQWAFGLRYSTSGSTPC